MSYLWLVEIPRGKEMGHVPQFPLQTKGFGETFPCACCPQPATSPKTEPLAWAKRGWDARRSGKK